MQGHCFGIFCNKVLKVPKTSVAACLAKPKCFFICQNFFICQIANLNRLRASLELSLSSYRF